MTKSQSTRLRIYNIRYRKHYATGSRQTARRTIHAADLPTAIARLETSIANRELNVTVSVLEAYSKTDTGWVKIIPTPSREEKKNA